MTQDIPSPAPSEIENGTPRRSIGLRFCAAEAIHAVRREDVGAAILDVNLSGQMVFPVAEELAARAIPFGFATGHGHAIVSKPWSDPLILPKPFSNLALEASIAKLTSSDD